MVETIGKQLCQARLTRGLSIDEAAHVTKVRPEKLIALENDDYSRFGSNAYAKGFLQIYGRYLGVDVSDQVKALETPRYVTISDYQYLNNAPEPEPTRIQLRHQNQRPSVMPLMIFAGLILVALVGLMGIWINVNMQRLESKNSAPASTAQTQNAPAQQQGSTSRPASTEGALTPSTSIASESGTSPSPRATEPGLVPIGGPLPAANTENAQPAKSGEGTPTAPQQANAQSQPTAAAPSSGVVTATPGINEIIVQPLKTTWVKVRRDSPTGEPIFEGDIYPNTRPLKLHGARFFVEVRDQDAVQIRKNGNPIAYQAPGISIQ